MHYIRYIGPWEDVAIGRHNLVSSHRIDTDDLTVAYFEQCGEGCWYDVPDHDVLRRGEVEITQAEFEAERDAINLQNESFVPAEPPPPAPDDLTLPQTMGELRALLAAQS